MEVRRLLTLTLTVELGADDEPNQREGQADALVERADPDRPLLADLDHRPIPLGFNPKHQTQKG
jgi:hypothetical protein